MKIILILFLVTLLVIIVIKAIVKRFYENAKEIYDKIMNPDNFK